MGQVTVLTAARMLEIEANSIVNARVDDGELVLITHGGEELNLGNIFTQPVGPTLAEVQALIDAAILAAGGSLDGDDDPDPDPEPSTPVILSASSFDTNPLDDYTAFDFTSKDGMTVSGGRLYPDPAAEKFHRLIRNDLTYTDGEAMITWVHGANENIETVTVYGKLVSAPNLLKATAQVGINGGISVHCVISNEVFELAAPEFDEVVFVPGQLYGMIMRVVGDSVTVEFWDQQPVPGGTPTATATSALSGTKKTVLGAGVEGYFGFGVGHFNVGDPQVAVEEVRFTSL